MGPLTPLHRYPSSREESIMKFSVHGPFEVSRLNSLVDASSAARKVFWHVVEASEPGLSSACGCYIFVVKAKRGTLPWYIGLTKRTFKLEALGSHQVNHYNPALVGKVGVKAQLFFLAKTTPTGRFAKPSKNSHADVEFLETFLFGVALNRNAALRNAKNTKFLRNISVPGVINSPKRRPTGSESKLSAALGL
jgi:hypothetical protein